MDAAGNARVEGMDRAKNFQRAFRVGDRCSDGRFDGHRAGHFAADVTDVASAS